MKTIRITVEFGNLEGGEMTPEAVRTYDINGLGSEGGLLDLEPRFVQAAAHKCYVMLTRDIIARELGSTR